MQLEKRRKQEGISSEREKKLKKKKNCLRKQEKKLKLNCLKAADRRQSIKFEQELAEILNRNY